MDDSTASLRDRAQQIPCPAPVIKGMTKEQMTALLEFKATLMTALDKLYLVVPQTQADALLKQFVDQLP